MSVSFIYPNQSHIKSIDDIDLDEDYDFFNTGERIWTVQTYLRLEQAGYDVNLSMKVPSSGTVVFHRHSLDHVKEHHSWTSGASLVCVRADKPPTPEADIEIVQNRYSADGERTHFIPHWPQPGLEPRNSDRGASVEVLSYKGAAAHLHDSLKSDRWHNFVRKNDLQWRSDGIEWKGRDHFHSDIPWTDYSDVNVVIALRSDLSCHYPNKPASKLINAWMAGVPAILGPEVAFQELRESDLDYIEAHSLDDVIEGVKRLNEDKSLYKKMAQNGKKRANEFSVEKIVKRWGKILFENGRKIEPNSILPIKYRNKNVVTEVYKYVRKKFPV